MFCVNITVTLNDDGILFHPYFNILFSQTLFETFNMLFMYIKSLLSILFHADNKMGRLIFDTPHKRCI